MNERPPATATAPDSAAETPFAPRESETLPPDALIAFREVSKWYGNAIGINHLTLSIGEGITGLLGPNGAGKSTLLQLATGQLRPSQGEVRVLGHDPWRNPGLNRHVGLCPEQDAFYEWMSGRDFVATCAELSGMTRRAARDAADHALELVGMTPHRDRAVKGYSKGMRQRTKLAQCLVHQPRALFLDEPLTGTDPVARREIMDVILELGSLGYSVVVSSHVLFEIESLTRKIVVINRGKLVAEGTIRQIRDLIDKHPHRIMLVADDPRAVAAELVRHPDVESLDFKVGGHGVLVETRRPDAFYARLPDLARDPRTMIRQVYSEDDSLEAVFKYLVNP